MTVFSHFCTPQSFSAFGQRRLLSGAWDERNTSEIADWNFSFHGQFVDAETGWINYGLRYYSVPLGRWNTKDSIEEFDDDNVMRFVQNTPVNYDDYIGLAKYKLNQMKCEFTVTMKIKVTFKQAPGKGKWTSQQKQTWKQQAEQQLESYYNNTGKTCKPKDKTCCTICPNGISIKFDLKYGWLFGDATDVMNDPTHQSYVQGDYGEFDIADVDPQDKGASVPQVPIVHEVGHKLGLPHPGQRLPANRRPAPNSAADYSADSESLMGAGMTMRKVDFDDAFCSKITVKGATADKCNPWAS